jgi:hypothetical protein
MVGCQQRRPARVSRVATEKKMAKRLLWFLTFGVVALSLAASPSFAQSSGGDSSGGGSGSSSSGGSGASSAGSGGTGAGGTNQSSSEGRGGPTSAGGDESGQGSQGDRNCSPSQMWDPQSMACVTK